MISESVIYHSYKVSGKVLQQLTALKLDGFVTINSLLNSDAGRLYLSLTKSGSTYTVNCYKDAARANLVASGTTTAIGTITLTASNSSGLSGSVYLTTYTADDTGIVADAFLSTDDDLPLNGIQALTEFDVLSGFAKYHMQAFNDLKERLKSKYDSQLWDDTFVNDPTNSVSGGCDLSRILNIKEGFRDYCRHKAFSYLMERHAVDPNSTFSERYKSAMSIAEGFFAARAIRLDTNGDKVRDVVRSGKVTKWARA